MTIWCVFYFEKEEDSMAQSSNGELIGVFYDEKDAMCVCDLANDCENGFYTIKEREVF